MKTKKRHGSRKKTKRYGSRKKTKRYRSRVVQRGGAAVCATGLCGASVAKIGSVIVGSLGSYSLLTRKRNGKKVNKKMIRKQSFKYEDNKGEKKDFMIQQINKKIITKNDKKEKKKTYKTLNQAIKAYDRKIKSCMKKKFKKC